MRSRPRRRALTAASVAIAAIVLTGCAGLGGASSTPGPGRLGELAGGNTLDQVVPPEAEQARLTDASGHRLTLASLKGRTVVVAPMLTFCQETCPMTSANLHRAAEDAVGKGLGDQVLFLEVSVDPARDGVDRLAGYRSLYGALPDWRLATGPIATVTGFWKGLGVSLKKTRPTGTVRDWLTGKLVHGNYDVLHQDLVMIIGPSGTLRWISVGRPDARGNVLPSTLRAYLDDQGRRNLNHPTAGGASAWTVDQVETALDYVRGNPLAG